MQVSYQLMKKTELYFGLDNAFDVKAPPIISGLPGDVTGTETDGGTYDPIGRRWYAGIRVKL
jgi:outer membrane receptor protein involved in Fe transport